MQKRIGGSFCARASERAHRGRTGFFRGKRETSGAEEQRKAGEDRAAVREGLKAEEQQILQEVLTEFLG